MKNVWFVNVRVLVYSTARGVLVQQRGDLRAAAGHTTGVMHGREEDGLETFVEPEVVIHPAAAPLHV